VSLKDEFDDELKDAMRTRDRNRVDVVRQIRTEVGRAMKAPGFSGEADDELYRATIASYAKKMGKALVEYEGFGERGAEAAAKLRFEVAYLSRWLPKAVSEKDVAAFVETAVQELGANGLKDVGRVMGALMKAHPGIDGAIASRLVRTRLTTD
jgi:uncharacterized protein YqeY